MRWDELTSDLFPEAVQKAEGVCLLPLSCVERHGHHLPLATDMFIGREVCNRAAVLEPAIVFPDYIFTQILEARHYPGCIGIEPELTIRLLENTCREIARNGLKKIEPAKGEKFDPHKHQAMMEQPGSDVAPGGVIQVLQSGYELLGRLVRPAMVVVAAKGAGAAPASGDGGANPYAANDEGDGASGGAFDTRA